MKHLLLFFALLACFVVGRNPAAALSADALFQQALTLERAQGDLKGAIALYERIVREYPGSRTVAARSLLQLGKAYERAGRDDARAAYERLVREYADQGELVAEARARIGELASPAPMSGGIELVKLDPALSTYGSWWLSFSADGRFFANLTPNGMDSLGYQVIGKPGTRFAPDIGSILDGQSLSPDGRHLAYVLTDSANTRTVRVLDTRNASMKAVGLLPGR